jgi:hypothetical protein
MRIDNIKMPCERKWAFAILLLRPLWIAHEVDQALQLVWLCGQEHDGTILTFVDAQRRQDLASQAGGDFAKVTIEVRIHFDKGGRARMGRQVDVFPCSCVEGAEISG